MFKRLSFAGACRSEPHPSTCPLLKLLKYIVEFPLNRWTGKVSKLTIIWEHVKAGYAGGWGRAMRLLACVFFYLSILSILSTIYKYRIYKDKSASNRWTGWTGKISTCPLTLNVERRDLN